MNMQETTKLRRQLLANGFTPLPNLDKRCVVPEWPRLPVDDKMIDCWTRMRRFAGTGIRVEGGLAVIDADVNDEAMSNAIFDMIVDTVPEIGAAGAPWLVRKGKGFKFAWFVRTAEVFSRLHTRRWVRPNDTADDGTHSVEIFGGGAPRQFGAFGPHTRQDDGTVTVEYEWVEGASPLDTKLADLPALTKDQFEAISMAAERLMEEAGWTMVKRSTFGESASHRVYDLTDDMVFDCDDGVTRSLADLRRLASFSGPVGLRCSASWLEGSSASNRSRCIIGSTKTGMLTIWETAAGVTHMPKPVEIDMKEVVAKIRRAQECIHVGP